MSDVIYWTEVDKDERGLQDQRGVGLTKGKDLQEVFARDY